MVFIYFHLTDWLYSVSNLLVLWPLGLSAEKACFFIHTAIFHADLVCNIEQSCPDQMKL